MDRPTSNEDSMKKTLSASAAALLLAACGGSNPVSYTHLTLPTILLV